MFAFDSDAMEERDVADGDIDDDPHGRLRGNVETVSDDEHEDGTSGAWTCKVLRLSVVVCLMKERDRVLIIVT